MRKHFGTYVSAVAGEYRCNAVRANLCKAGVSVEGLGWHCPHVTGSVVDERSKNLHRVLRMRKYARDQTLL